MSPSRPVDPMPRSRRPDRAWHRLRPPLVLGLALLTVAAMSAALPQAAQAAPAQPAHASAQPNLGPHVRIFDPSMSVTQIQTEVDAIAQQQVGNQFGSERYALLFKPGTYGTATEPLNFQVGYYTEVAGLGLSPSDVVINGSVYVHNQCDANGCVALNNFWRSLENLTINVTTPDFGCYSGEFWAVSQAAPMRRVDVQGAMTLMDYCTGPSYASGGFIADSRLSATVVNGSQQQWITRNSTIGGWSNGVWNQVFSGVQGAPAPCFPAVADVCGPYTVVAASPVSGRSRSSTSTTRAAGRSSSPRHGATAAAPRGRRARRRAAPCRCRGSRSSAPTTTCATMHDDLARGKNLLITPGVYDVGRP